MDKKSGVEKNPVLPLQQPILLGCLGFGFLWFALPIYSKILGASVLEIGGIFSIFSLNIALLRPLIGIAYQAVFLQEGVVHQILKKEMHHAIKS